MEDTLLNDNAGWQQEAQAVINDVRVGVKEICVSQVLTNSTTKIYLNVTTLEGESFCIELTAGGFRVVGKRYDFTEEPEENYFETPYSLLSSKSILFTQAFGSSLIDKLTDVQRKKKDDEADEDSDGGGGGGEEIISSN